MGVIMKTTYIGDDQVELVHTPSGAVIRTDLPVDNGGKGRSFSPTDLFAASLPACIMSIMSKVAANNGEKLDGTTIEIEKNMTENPRQVGHLILKLKFAEGIKEENKKKYRACIDACPVHRSLHPNVKVEIVEQ